MTLSALPDGFTLPRVKGGYKELSHLLIKPGGIFHILLGRSQRLAWDGQL